MIVSDSPFKNSVRLTGIPDKSGQKNKINHVMSRQKVGFKMGQGGNFFPIPGPCL
jgi:hypothetical protein